MSRGQEHPCTCMKLGLFVLLRSFVIYAYISYRLCIYSESDSLDLGARPHLAGLK